MSTSSSPDKDPEGSTVVASVPPEIAVSDDDDDANATGYVAPPPRPTEELANLDAEDESLQKWKKSLGLGEVSAAKNANDPRRVVPLEIRVIIENGETITVDCSGKNTEMSKFSVKEGSNYKIEIRAVIQNEIAPRLRYRHKVRRMGVLVEKHEQVIGSYSPRVEPYVLEACSSSTPSGMLARGTYQLSCELLDDDCKGVPHLSYECEMKIIK